METLEGSSPATSAFVAAAAAAAAAVAVAVAAGETGADSCGAAASPPVSWSGQQTGEARAAASQRCRLSMKRRSKGA